MRKKNIMKLLFGFVFISLACAGLGVSSTPTPAIVASKTPTRVPTMTFLPTLLPVLSPVARPVDTLAPTEAPPTSDVEVSTTNQIYFQDGTTSALVKGGVNPGKVVKYALYIVGDQPVQIEVVSSNNDVTLAIYDPARYELLSPSKHEQNWKGYFKREGYYYVNVHGGAETSTFALSISAAARINFNEEENFATRTGYALSGSPVTYAMSVPKDRSLYVNLTAPSGAAALEIRGFDDGLVFLPAADKKTEFTLLIPATQDYVIEIVPQGGGAIRYKLYVAVY